MIRKLNIKKVASFEEYNQNFDFQKIIKVVLMEYVMIKVEING
jgi:hypothetical protein